MPALSAAELADARAMQAIAMQDQCTIVRFTGEPGWDPVTESATRPTTTIYTGVCRVQPSARAQREVVSVDEQVTIAEFAAAVPWDVSDVQVNDLLTVTASADPALAGATVRVVDVQASTFATARHLTCTRNLTPGGA